MGSTAHPQVASNYRSIGEYPKVDWDGLYARHAPSLYRRALGIMRNPEDAEDALQEGLLSAFRNLHRFEGRSGLSTWLTRIVINAALMQLRNRRTRETASLDEPVDDTVMPMVERIVDTAPNAEQIFLMTELRRALARSIRGLSPEMQTAVSLMCIQGLSTREAARRCGINENTLKSRLRRARLRLASSKSLMALL